jgi:hypothetical protein
MTIAVTFLKQAGVMAAALPFGASLHSAGQATTAPVASANKWTQLRQLFDQDPQATFTFPTS